MLLRMGPALVGLMLISFGILVLLRPEVLAYLVATVFIFSGIGIVSFAMLARVTIGSRNESQVFYRRIDGDQ